MVSVIIWNMDKDFFYFTSFEQNSFCSFEKYRLLKTDGFL